MRSYGIVRPQEHIQPLQNHLSNRPLQRREYQASGGKVSDTNMRIQQIKKKYDTPSRREKIESMKKSKEMELKENHFQGRLEGIRGKGVYEGREFVERENREREIRGRERQNRDRETKKQCEGVGAAQYRSSRIRQDQESIFSRMRQMKESFMANDFIKPSVSVRGNFDKNKVATIQDFIGRKDQYDPRVENIDKINTKIKQILNCLTENQKKGQRGVLRSGGNVQLEGQNSSRQSAFFGSRLSREINGDNRRMTEGFSQKSSELTNINSQQLPTPNTKPRNDYHYKATERVQKPQSQNFQLQNAPKQEQSVPSNKAGRVNSYSSDRYLLEARFARGDLSTTKPQKPQQSWKKRSYLQGGKQVLKASRSKSYIDSIKKSQYADDPNYQLQNGKKLNEEISKIQRKIEEFEEEKKRLNIEFTPFSAKGRPVSNGSNGSAAAGKSCRFERVMSTLKEREGKVGEQGIKKGEGSHGHGHGHGHGYSQIYEQNKLQCSGQCQGKCSGKCSGDYSGQKLSQFVPIVAKPTISAEGTVATTGLQNIEITTLRLQKKIEGGQADVQKRVQFDPSELMRQTDNNINSRRKRLQQILSDDSIKGKAIKRLVTLLCQQVSLDQQLRNMKIWFESIIEPNKYTKLRQILLQTYKLKLTEEQCMGQFKLSQNQNNPFFTMQGFDGSCEALARCYVQAKTFWSDNVAGKLDRKELQGEKFVASKIDMEKKGYIELEDLVRFLNIESGIFFRNRDVFLIFRRLSKESRTSFETLLEGISKI